MRFSGKVAIVLCTGVAAVGLALGQQPGGGRFGRGGFGGAGANPDPATLLRRPDVRKELKLTDEQLEKVPDAVLKALAEVLNPEQMKRLRQIDLQVKGYKALNDSKVQMALKLSTEQKDNLKTILDDSDKEMKEVMKEAQGGGGGFQGVFEKLTTLRKEAQDKAMGVLNAEQKSAWQEMTGEEFKMDPQGGFGGKGGRGGKGKKNKNDA
jgi:hypothetical protein